MKRKQIRPLIERLENRRLLVTDLIQVGFFDTWDGEIPSTDVAGIAYHSVSDSLYLADSEINETPLFNGNNIFASSLDGGTLQQQFISNNNEPTGIVFSEFDGFFYVTNDSGANKGIYRYDDSLNSPLAMVDTDNGAPGVTDPEGITADPATGMLYVADGIGGGMRVLEYDSDLVFQSSFSVGSHMTDAEGIAFHADRGNLFIVSNPDLSVFEFSVTGSLINQFDISGFAPTPNAPQGLTFAPTSDPNDAADELALYIADGGFDEFPDGRVFEAVLTCDVVAPQNCAPHVSSGGDQTIVVVDFGTDFAFLDGTVLDDNLPAPPSVTTQWIQVSGPAAISFTDAAAVDTTASFTQAGTYVVRLTADDGELMSLDEATLVVIEQPSHTTIEEVRVQASSDDAEEKANGSMKLPNSDLELVFDEGGNQKIGVRFAAVNVPAGATIVNAYVQFQADETNSGLTQLTIEGEARDDPPGFAPLFADISSRSRTNTSTLWTPAPWTTKGEAGPDQQTPNIAGVIQEIVDRSGWSSGNALVIIVTGSGERVAESYDGDQNGAPLLHVEFTTNNSPTATNLTQLQTYTEGAASVALDDIAVADPDVGETITAQLTLSNVATGSLTTGTFGGTTSTYSPGTGLWEAVGTVTDVNAALADVAFLPLTENDVDTTVNTHVEDQAGAGPTDGTITLDVTPLNDPPTATNLNQLKTYTEGTVSVALDDIVITDPDSGDTITAQLTLNNVTTGSLTTGTFGATSSTFNPGTGLWEAIGTVTDVNAALADVAFLPMAENELDTTLTTHIEDLAATGPADGTIALDVTPLNDPPTATNLTQLQTYTEGAPSVDLDDIVVTDPDFGETITAQLTLNNVTTGSLSTGTFGGTTSTYNPVTGLWEAIGTVTDVNAALADVAFLPMPSNELDTIVITHVEDQAGTGPADGIISLDVMRPNDPPAATNLTQLQTYTEGAASVALDDIVVTDPDAGETITAQLTLNNVATGSLTTGIFGSTTSTYNPGTGLWEAVGTETDVNAALADVEFLPLPDNDLDTTINTHVEDSQGEGPIDGTITLDVTGVNDPPVVNDQTFSVDENSPIGTVVGTVVATDPDTGQILSFDITAGNGSGAFAIDTLSGEITVADSGPLDFETTPSFNLTVEVSDDGVPSLSDTATITINLNDVGEDPITIETRVLASTDDAEEKPSGGMKLPNKDLELVFDNGIQQVGMRFVAVAVPAGATIVNAYIQFKADETDSIPTLLTFEGEATDDAPTFTSVAMNISSRARTASSVNWAPAPWPQKGLAGPDQQTPDLSVVIQEIVDRPGWATGNALVIIVTGTGERVAESYDGDQAGAPLLHVEYMPGGAASIALPDLPSSGQTPFAALNAFATVSELSRRAARDFIDRDVTIMSDSASRNGTVPLMGFVERLGAQHFEPASRAHEEPLSHESMQIQEELLELVFAELGDDSQF